MYEQVQRAVSYWLAKGNGNKLLLTAYYNFYGPTCYYPLLSQSAQGEG
jgi:alpha 1,2-mannosyltransferase